MFRVSRSRLCGGPAAPVGQHAAPATRRKFDVCVIGGGPAGLAAALRAVDYKRTACIIEANRIGGADLWDGALQSKTLWEMSKLYRLINGKTAERMMTKEKELPELQHDHLYKALVNASEFREQQLLHQLASAGIPLIKGYGKLLSNTTVKVVTTPHEVQGNEETPVMTAGEDEISEIIEADHVVLAAGAEPRPHPLVPIDKEVVVTSDELMRQPFPKSIVIIGAGVIGCEFASILANFGQTEVNIIDKSPRILPMEDEDIALFVQNLLAKKNVTFHHRSTLIAAEVTADNRFQYTLSDMQSGEQTTHTVDKALVSIGRVPRSKSLGLQEIGAAINDKGSIDRDRFFRVQPFKNIYAVGDLTTRMALVNVGELEGRCCVDHMFHPYPEDELFLKMDNLSTIMFLDQEVASVGVNEQMCKKQNIAYKMAKYGYEFVSRAVAMGNTRGFVKLIVTNDRKMQVLGVRAVGPHASSIVELASLAIHKKESAYKLGELLTAYPAVTQGFQECLRMLLGTSILKPNVFPELVVTEWRPPGFERGRAHQQEMLHEQLQVKAPKRAPSAFEETPKARPSGSA